MRWCVIDTAFKVSLNASPRRAKRAPPEGLSIPKPDPFGHSLPARVYGSCDPDGTRGSGRRGWASCRYAPLGHDLGEGSRERTLVERPNPTIQSMCNSSLLRTEFSSPALGAYRQPRDRGLPSGWLSLASDGGHGFPGLPHSQQRTVGRPRVCGPVVLCWYPGIASGPPVACGRDSTRSQL